MQLLNDIKPISYVKSHAAEILNDINSTHRPLFVTQNGEARAVIMDPASYQNMQDSLKIMKLISQSEDNIAQGKTTEHSAFFKNLEKKMGIK